MVGEKEIPVLVIVTAIYEIVLFEMVSLLQIAPYIESKSISQPLGLYFDDCTLLRIVSYARIHN